VSSPVRTAARNAIQRGAVQTTSASSDCNALQGCDGVRCDENDESSPAAGYGAVFSECLLTLSRDIQFALKQHYIYNRRRRGSRRPRAGRRHATTSPVARHWPVLPTLASVFQPIRAGVVWRVLVMHFLEVS